MGSPWPRLGNRRPCCPIQLCGNAPDSTKPRDIAIPLPHLRYSVTRTTGGGGTGLEVWKSAMTILPSALLVLLATMAVACNRLDSAETKAAADTADAQRAVNQSAPAPLPATQATATPDGQPINAMGAAILAFHKHLEAYMKVHNEAESKVPNLKRTDDPDEISGREK